MHQEASYIIPLPLVALPLGFLKQCSKLCLWSNLPVVLLFMRGDRLEILTAVFTEAVHAIKLTSASDLMIPGDNILRIYSWG